MAHPQNLYFLALAIIAIPLLPFSRSAIVVAAAWLPGQFSFLIGADPAWVDMCTALFAFAAGLALALNDRDQAVATTYLATFAVHFCFLIHNLDSYNQYWIDYWLAMARVLLIPSTLDWSEIKDTWEAFKHRREYDEIIWRRMLCW